MIGFILLAVLVSSQEDNFTDDGLKNWLKNVRLFVTNITLQMKVIVDIDVFANNMTFTEIELHDLSIIKHPRSDLPEGTIEVNATISANLAGHVQLTVVSYKDEPAVMNGRMEYATLSIILQVDKDQNGLVYQIVDVTDSCVFPIKNITLSMVAENSGLNNMLIFGKNLMPAEMQKTTQKMICETLHDLLNNTVNPLLEELNDYLTPLLVEQKPKRINVDPGMFDLHNSQIVDAARYLLTEFIGINGKMNINKLINLITKGTGIFSVAELLNSLNIPTPIEISVPVDEIGGVFKINISDLIVSGLNTWNDFSWLDPVTNYMLETHTGMNDLGLNISIGLGLHADSEMLSSGNSSLKESTDIDLLLHKNTMMMDLQLASPTGAGMNYTSPMCLELGCIEKLISGHGTGFNYLGLKTDLDYLKLDESKGTFDLYIIEAINNLSLFVIDELRPIMQPLIKGVINDQVTTTVNDLLNEEIQKANCSFKKENTLKEFDVAVTCGVFGGAILLSLIVLIIVISIVRYDRQKELMTLQVDAPLVITNKLPLYVRIGMVLLILANIALFISSNTGIGASVFIKFFIGDKKVEMDSLFDFGLINSVVDMWYSRSYFLSILIAVMSCIWPYTKLLLMLIAWFFPGNVFPPKRRKRMLEVLDALGKWSLVDSFVLVLMLVAFHMKIEFPTMSPTIDHSLSVNLFVFPAYGFIALILGTLVSLALSHIILAIDRYVDEIDNPLNTVSEEQTGVYFSLVPNMWEAVLVTVMIVVAFILLFFGITSTSFSFQFIGLAGWGLMELDIQYKKDYSLISLGMLIPEAAEYPNSFTVRFTQIIYFLTTVCLPAAHLITLAVTWIGPFSKRIQRKLHITCEILFAWSTVDVFVLSILAAVLEISRLADFMVGDKCDSIRPAIETYFGDFERVKGNNKCFGVETKLESGVWMLVVSAVFHDVLTIVINHLVRKGLSNVVVISDDENSTTNSSGEKDEEPDII